jgi:hypothetical protein
MKKHWILLTSLVACCGLFSSCADPYYGSGYGAGPYPANAAEAAVPIVVGAAVVGAILNNNRPNKNYHGGHNHYCPPPRRHW